jgi:hypothetical protein
MSQHSIQNQIMKVKLLIVFLYVDDMIYTGNLMLEEFKACHENRV